MNESRISELEKRCKRLGFTFPEYRVMTAREKQQAHWKYLDEKNNFSEHHPRQIWQKLHSPTRGPFS